MAGGCKHAGPHVFVLLVTVAAARAYTQLCDGALLQRFSTSHVLTD